MPFRNLIRMRKPLPIGPSMVLLLSALPLPVQTKSLSPSFHVGVARRSFHPDKADYDWRAAETHALLTTIWYPISAGIPIEQQFAGSPEDAIVLAGAAAPDAPLAPSARPYPLILLSHGSGGSALMMAWLGTRLAEQGYIAAAVNHPGNNALEHYTPQGFTFWWERATDISQLLTAMLSDPTFGSHIDPRRIGGAGFSIGGFTMIELAGGIGTLPALQRFCASPQADDTCRDQLEFPHLREKAEQLLKTDAQFQSAVADSFRSHRDERIRAVFAIAPALGPTFQVSDLQKIAIPVEIVAGIADPIVPVKTSAEFFARYIPHAQLRLYGGGVRHYTFLGTCTALGMKSQPALCVDLPGVDREAIHAKATSEAINFFNAHLPQ